jgi:hypothetical protein
MGFLPPLLLVLGLLSAAHPALVLWAATSSAAMLVWWLVVYTTIRESPLCAFLYPLGAVMLFYIIVTAVLRGRRVTWKGRTYISQR